MFAFLLSPLNRVLAIAGIIFTLVVSVYGKGRKDASDKAKLKALTETQDAIERANNARNASAHQSDTGRLLDDDGFKRD
jgi:cbb3-type cytochrome oxidase subunit 3